MKLDVVVPTYNRSALLRKTIDSLLRSPAPADLEITIIVVDNNSTDDTRDVVLAMQKLAERPIVYVHEEAQGSSQSRNAGIRAGNAEIIGFVDDDEEIDSQWFNVVAREFADPETEFIGGPYLPNCDFPMPAWLPPGFNGVIGVITPKPRSVMDTEFPGNLNGGNAILRRSVFDRVGFYNPNLGRSSKRLLSDEDAEFYRRALHAGIRGLHVPDLIIYHYIPAHRLTRRYHRRWCFWRGVSQGVVARTEQESVSYSFGVPRYRLGQALDGIIATAKNFFSRSESGASFTRELHLWTFLGFVYGRFFANAKKFYVKS